MRKDFGTKTWLYPMPVLIVAAYDENGVPNAMNAAWGGINTDDRIGICLAENHKTTQNILHTQAFTVSMATVGQLQACDYVGIVSGNNTPDKIARAGFTTTKAQYVNAPIIEQLPMTIECKLVSYDQESNYMIGDIVNISADESIISNGKIDVMKLQPIIYDTINHKYHAIGEVVGNAFCDGKNLK